MKIIRFQDDSGKIRYAGAVSGDDYRLIDGDIFGPHALTSEPAMVRKLLAPIVPVAILCIGSNYKQHVIETNAEMPEFPVLFMKAPAALLNPDEPIQIPTALKSTKVDHECELAVVIGRTCKNASREKALDYVLGYTCANDVTARDWQKQWGGSQWCRGKSFDTFAPLGPCLVTRESIPDPSGLRIQTRVNGQTFQDSNTRDMIFDVPTLIEFLSGSTTLAAGTVILTGTPQGVGVAANPPRFLKAGDRVTVEIEGIGKLSNGVENEGV